MGEVLAFRVPEKNRRVSRRSEPGAVVIFTGVRRELIAEVSGTPPRRPTKKPSGLKRRKSAAAFLNDAL